MKLVPCMTWRPPPDHPSPEEGYRDPPRRHSSQVTFFATESLWLWEQRHLFFTAPWMHLDYPRSSHGLTGAMVECSYATWDQLSGKNTLWLEYNPWKLLPFYMGENRWLLITRIDVHTLGHGNCKASITSRISCDTSLSCLIVNTLKFPTIVFLRLFHRFWTTSPRTWAFLVAKLTTSFTWDLLLPRLAHATTGCSFWSEFFREHEVYIPSDLPCFLQGRQTNNFHEKKTTLVGLCCLILWQRNFKKHVFPIY